ncbi:MAG: FGGY family carbohydrate kinase [Patescibacteria group bacterium]|nr:FGGY family carbohydrate kinase [Patescibacteria group bacterium]
MKYVLALDIGTTSTRAVLFDHRLKKNGQISKTLSIYADESGMVEQDPEELWLKTLHCAKEVVKTCRVAAKDIGCIGLANQRETVIAWSLKTRKPVSRAVVWQDRRTAERCRALESNRPLARRIRATTGLVIDSCFSATKIEWLNKKFNHGKTDGLVFGTVDSWILWNLTGGRVFATDPSNASRTMLMDLKTADWDEELLSLFNVKREQLARVLPSEGQFGLTDKKLFGKEIPITGILGDQQASLFSHGPMKADMLAVTYGTGIFTLKQIGDTPRPAGSGILTTVAWQRQGKPTEFAYETSALTGGAMLEWFKNQMGLVKDMKELDALAESVPTTGGVTVVPAFAGLAAPDWDPAARGLIIGLNRGTTKAHLCRAAIEAIACQAARMAKLIEEQTGSKATYWKVSGGLTRSNPLLQSQADVSKAKICRSAHVESTAAGAAMIAGLGAGVWKTWLGAAHFVVCEKIFKPKRVSRGQAYLAQYERALERSKNWAI